MAMTVLSLTLLFLACAGPQTALDDSGDLEPWVAPTEQPGPSQGPALRLRPWMWRPPSGVPPMCLTPASLELEAPVSVATPAWAVKGCLWAVRCYDPTWTTWGADAGSMGTPVELPAVVDLVVVAPSSAGPVWCEAVHAGGEELWLVD